MVNCNYVDITEKLQEQINACGNEAVLTLPEGRVHLTRKIYIKNKVGLTLKGNNTTIVSAFDPCEGFFEYSGIFAFEGCKGLTLESIKIDTDVPVNSAGVVVAKDVEGRTIDLEMFDDCKMDGSQTIFGINSIDAGGTPEITLATTGHKGAITYEMLNSNTARIYFNPKYYPSLKAQIERLPIGMKVCIRHGVGNFKVLENSAITFKNCDDTIIRDITMYSSPGFAIVVFPRCHNMTIEGYRVEVPNGSNRLMASNIDAIHLLGLSGKLVVKDCYFDGLGDDALNIHSTAGIVNSIKENIIEAINGRFNIPLEDEWCRAGDKIAVYDKNFTYKGNFRVEQFNESNITFTDLNCDINTGDVLANTSFYAQTEVIGCEIRNTRARGLLFQTENITVKDCKFYGIASPAILLSTDIVQWYEVGPVKNCIIENCEFEKCACSNGTIPLGVIVAKVSHNAEPNENCPFGVHKNITVRNNRFIDTPKGNTMFFESVDGLEIYDNSFEKNEKIFLAQCSNTKIK